jgi:Nucleotidyl transferase AbiEii toxin, Type IV TA system
VRERQLFIFERFLARAQATDMDVVVKVGMALELRTQRARSTRDIDLRAMGASESFERALLALAARTGEDFLTFRVHNHGKPDIDALEMKYGGRRYRVQAHLAGKLYGDPFGVDVAFGEPMFGAPDRVRGRADLSFIGVEAPELTVYPRLTHIAEKLHAYTVPRPSPNSRVRDIPDLALLAELEGATNATDLRRSPRSSGRWWDYSIPRWRVVRGAVVRTDGCGRRGSDRRGAKSARRTAN